MRPLRFGRLFEPGGVETVADPPLVTGKTVPHPGRRVAADGRGPPGRIRAIARTVPR